MIEHWIDEMYGVPLDPERYKVLCMFGANPEVEEVLLNHGCRGGLRIYDDRPDSAAVLSSRTGTWKEGFEYVKEQCAQKKQVWLCCGVAAAPGLRRRAVARIQEELGSVGGWSWHTVVAASAHVGMGAELGRGVLVLDMAYVGPQAQIEDHAVLLPGGKVYHNARVGSGTIIVGGATVLGRCRVGCWCHVCANAVVLPEGTIGPGSTIGVGLSAKRLGHPDEADL